MDMGATEHKWIRKGPWTEKEDWALINHIAVHGQGRWNAIAVNAGLRRTGKSCRLRWVNYLRPDVRRGNITPEEQLLILQLHSRWGNRWSKIAQCLPGRTDNEIKNFWRTRVQKQAKKLRCEVDSEQFKDAVRYLWIPRLLERICSASNPSTATVESSSTRDSTSINLTRLQQMRSNYSACSSSTVATYSHDDDELSPGKVVSPYPIDQSDSVDGKHGIKLSGGSVISMQQRDGQYYDKIVQVDQGSDEHSILMTSCSDVGDSVDAGLDFRWGSRRGGLRMRHYMKEMIIGSIGSSRSNYLTGFNFLKNACLCLGEYLYNKLK